MDNTKSSKTKSFNYSNSPAPNLYTQLTYRPFASQPPKAPVAPKTQTDVENEAFTQEQMEATGLEIQAKYGSITPEAQERLTVLQSKMDGLLNSRLEHATRFGHNIANIPLRRPDTPTPIQAKLTIGEPGDKYEQEADAIASFVVQRIHQQKSEKLQRESLPEGDYMQMKPMVQRRAYVGGIAASPDLETGIQQARGSGQPLAKGVREPMEQVFGSDFSGVRVHTDSQADQLNQSIQAKAFTTGQDVFFQQGAYEPESRGGQELLAHELTHVVQQNGGNVQIQSKQEMGSGNICGRSNTRYTLHKIHRDVIQRGLLTNLIGKISPTVKVVGTKIPKQVWRVDTRPPKELLPRGFQPKANIIKKSFAALTYEDVEAYQKSNINNPGLLSTSDDKESALKFGRSNPAFENKKFYLYKINVPDGIKGININETLTFWDNRFPNQNEVLLCGDIPGENIEMEAEEIGEGKVVDDSPPGYD